MRRNLIIGLLPLALIAGILVYNAKGQFGQSTEPKTATQIETETVAQNDDSEVKEFTIAGDNFSYEPALITVKKGDKVRINFVNVEGFHDLIIDGMDVATSKIQTGETETIEFTANQAGTFEYYCSVGSHRANGMFGALIVE